MWSQAGNTITNIVTMLKYLNINIWIMKIYIFIFIYSHLQWRCIQVTWSKLCPVVFLRLYWIIMACRSEAMSLPLRQVNGMQSSLERSYIILSQVLLKRLVNQCQETVNINVIQATVSVKKEDPHMRHTIIK